MGLFDKVFKSQRDIAKEEVKETPWNVLTSSDEIDTVLRESEGKRVAIFKHSTRCGISRMVLKTFENAYDPETHGQIKLYFLDLLANRELSNEIAVRLEVHHESPQLIVLENGQVVHHASHHAISVDALQQ